MIRTLNGISSQNVININSLIGGNGVNIVDSTINVDISKQTEKSVISDTDLFVLEDSSGAILKITGANLKASAEQSTVVAPLSISGNAISIKGLSGFTANKILKVNSVGDSITYADDLWDETNDILRPFYTTSNVLIGGVNMDGNLFKFQVEGNSYINGNLLIETYTNTANRQLVVNGTSEFQGLIHSKGTLSTPGYINIYAIDKNYHTSLYPTENVNVNITMPNITTTLIGTNTIDILTGKTLISPTITGTGNIAGNFTGNLTGNADTSTKIADITNSNIVQLTESQTLTNKTFNDLKINLNEKIISNNNTDDYLQFADRTFINNYLSNVFTYGLSFGSTADITLSTGRNISRATDSTDRITFNSGNFTFGNTGIFNNSVIVKSTDNSNSGFVSFFEASNNGNNNIDLHAPLITTHDYNTYLPTITDTNIIDVYVLSNRNVLGGTNVNISNSTTDTITINSTDTTYSGGTNITLSGTTFNLDTTITGTTLSTGTVYNGNTIGVNYGGTNITSYTVGDILYASTTSALSKLAKGSANTFLMSNGTIPFYSLGYSFQNPISVSSMNVSLEGLSGFGTNNQIICTNGTDALQYRTLTAGTNIEIVNSSSTITISGPTVYWKNANTIGVLDIEPIDTVNDIDLDAINLLVIPKTVNVIPTGLASGKVIQYDDNLGGGNGSMVFGDNGSSASVNWDTGIYAKQFINMKCGTDILLQLNNTPASVASATFTLDDININLGTNNTYSNILNANCQPLMLLNTASSGTIHSHLVLKRDNLQSDFIVIRQNNNDELLFHHENSGDDFVVGKAFEYGNKGAKWKYTDPSTYLYNSEDTNGASTVAGSVMSYHKDGSTVFFNTTSAYSSGDTNYFSFAKSNDQQARITMDGNAQIAVAWLDSNDPSDRRIKYDIQDYQNATAVINKIKIKSFMKHQLKNFNNDNEGKMLPFKDRLGEAKYSIGVIAQDIAEIPELKFMVEGSFEDKVNPAYIHNYIPIISLLVKSNQEQQQTINELKATIDKLNSSTSFKEFKSK